VILENELSDYLLIKEIFDEENETVGFRTIVMQLFQRYGIIMNHKKVIRIMNKYCLVCKIRRKKFYGNTFNQQRIENTYENLLNTVFDCTKPSTIFHTDITYIKYAYGRKTAYLSAVKDEATREVSAHAVSESLEMSFVIETLDKLQIETLDSKAIIHSDQGSHYTSNSYKEKIQEVGLIGSMSRRGRCVDNAPIETFFGHMKDELDFRKLKTYDEVVDEIEKYIYRYNNLRPQWTLKKMTPKAYRNHLLNVV
jgi:transposase InsO family protein